MLRRARLQRAGQNAVGFGLLAEKGGVTRASSPSQRLRPPWRGLAPRRHKAHAVTLVLEAREAPPAAVLALLLGGGERWSVDYDNVAARQREGEFRIEWLGAVEGCSPGVRADRVRGRAGRTVIYYGDLVVGV